MFILFGIQNIHFYSHPRVNIIGHSLLYCYNHINTLNKFYCYEIAKAYAVLRAHTSQLIFRKLKKKKKKPLKRNHRTNKVCKSTF